MKGNAGGKERRCDFAIQLMTLVEAGDLTGYYAEVTRELDRQKRYIGRDFLVLHYTAIHMCVLLLVKYS